MDSFLWLAGMPGNQWKQAGSLKVSELHHDHMRTSDLNKMAPKVSAFTLDTQSGHPRSRTNGCLIAFWRLQIRDSVILGWSRGHQKWCKKPARLWICRSTSRTAHINNHLMLSARLPTSIAASIYNAMMGLLCCAVSLLKPSKTKVIAKNVMQICAHNRKKKAKNEKFTEPS